MSEPTRDSTVEITTAGQTIASAHINTSTDPHGTARITFQAQSGHLPPGTRSDLVDAALDLPAVCDSDHLQACVPAGDSESMDRLRQRTTAMSTRAAGATALVDAELPTPLEPITADSAKDR
jgi:hypothetical protein